MELIEEQARIRELPKPEKVECPYEEDYKTDVLVVGCGFAGLNAAVSAREKRRDVLVIDKGRPGYSGLSPWPSSFRWFDPDRGDDADAFKEAIQKGGDYLSNQKWYECWIRESKNIYLRLKEWGILAQYPRAAETGTFYEKEDFIGYREFFDQLDRHKKWIQVLERYEIPFLEHTMIADLITENQTVAGAIGFHVPSGKIIKIKAKAIVLAAGGGCYKPTGYPVGTDTFDGEYIAYQLGLPIMGKEFEDFHSTSSQAPGNVFLDNHWQYLENIWLCGGDIEKDNVEQYAAGKGNAMTLGRVRQAMNGVPTTTGEEIQDVSKAFYTRRGGSKFYETDEKEVRSGKMSTPVVASTLAGAATGMCCHLTSGVFCGLDETDCGTSVKGLYVAGDGMHATSPSGAAYPCGVGFTSCFTSIDGDHAGKAAADYAGKTEQIVFSDERFKEKEEKILSPLKRKNGFDPNWARDVLHSIMAPYWVSVVKSETMLQAALTQILYMRDHVIPNLSAASSHDVRLCMEMEHKILSAEMKIRASLERKESRGNTYRIDYPYRDDENYLCYITLQKADDESMSIRRVPIPDEWTGDKELPYEKRYVYYFPGESEAKGFEASRMEFGKTKGTKL